MAFDPQFASTVKAAVVVVSTANTSRAQTASNTGITTLYSAGANGSRIDDITIIPAVTTTTGMIRLWLNDGTNNTVLAEYIIDAATISATVPPTPINLTNLGICLQTGWSLKASNNNAEAISVFVTRAGDF